jgi:hypothetical protein
MLILIFRNLQYTWKRIEIEVFQWYKINIQTHCPADKKLHSSTEGKVKGKVVTVTN